MKIQFQGSPDPDDVADAFILAYLASRKGSPVKAEQVWKSLRARGFVPTDGRPTSASDPDDGAGIAEVGRRLQEWLKQGLVGGDAEPEAISQDRHFWVIGNSPSKG
jgi:pentatricopeptide repeat protein